MFVTSKCVDIIGILKRNDIRIDTAKVRRYVYNTFIFGARWESVQKLLDILNTVSSQWVIDKSTFCI